MKASLIFHLPAALGAAGLLGLAAMLLVDVTCRAFGMPLLGTQDLAEAALILVTLGALAALETEDGHIRVDLLASKLPPRVQQSVEIARALLTTALWLGLALCLLEAAELSRLLGLASNILAIPKAPLQGLAAALVGLAALAAAARPLIRRGRDDA